MLKIKLFRGFAVIVVIFSILSAVVGVQTLHNRVLEEAQARVRLDLSSAWAVYNSQLRQIETILKLAATKELVVDAFDSQKWDSPELTARLEKLRVNFGLDFLSLVSDEGRVVLRTTPPFARGDYRGTEPALSRALGGETLSCMSVWSARLKPAGWLCSAPFLLRRQGACWGSSTAV
jgi:hypothetical protein